MTDAIKSEPEDLPHFRGLRRIRSGSTANGDIWFEDMISGAQAAKAAFLLGNASNARTPAVVNVAS